MITLQPVGEKTLELVDDDCAFGSMSPIEALELADELQKWAWSAERFGRLLCLYPPATELCMALKNRKVIDAKEMGPNDVRLKLSNGNAVRIDFHPSVDHDWGNLIVETGRDCWPADE